MGVRRGRALTWKETAGRLSLEGGLRSFRGLGDCTIDFNDFDEFTAGWRTLLPLMGGQPTMRTP